MNRKQAAYDLIELSLQHVDKAAMESSARICIEDACKCYLRDDFGHAVERALDSLAYSIGILHPDYAKARAMVRS